MEENRKDNRIEKTDPMEYLEGMEIIDSDMMDQVLEFRKHYNDNEYTGKEVLAALKKEYLNIHDFAVLLSSAAGKYLEEMAQKAMQETRKHFGNSINMFTPLYIANYCENECVYCGFNCKNKIHRGKLTLEEIEEEMQTISSTGLKEILLLTGESSKCSGIEYIAEAVKIAQKYFSTIGIEIYPLDTQGYSYLQRCGVDFVSIYQETYSTVKYDEMHPKGSKRVFPYRFYSQERAMLGGMRGVAFGALLGLDDFRKDAFSTGVHAYLLQKKYPQAEISFSTPRLRPFGNHQKNKLNDVYEPQLLQVMLAFRLFMPFAGLTISTRERAVFRDHVIGMCATKISAGVSVGVGGHAEEAKGDEQFEISDPRSVEEVRHMMIRRGLQPVYTDYVRV